MASFIQAGGQILQSQGEASADKFNARMQEQQASQSLQQAYLKSGMMQQQMARQQGAIRAAYGGSGVTSSGTPLAVMLDQATQGEMRRQMGLYQGRVDATSHMQQGDADRAQASAALRGGWIKAGGTILTQAEKVAGANGMQMPSYMG